MIFGGFSILFFALFGLVAESPGPPKTEFGEETSPVSQEGTPENYQKESFDGEKVAGQSKEIPSGTTLCSISIGEVAKTELLPLVSWTDGAVSINLPAGWNVFTGGECATKSILARDAFSELKQVFYFSEAGPVYTSQERKVWDYNYMQMGGDNMPWFESPLVNPLTAENYLMNFSALALTSFFNRLFPGFRL